MTQQIDRYVVFGNPIGHSKSPFIHTLFARQTNQPLSYTAELAPVDGFKQAAELFFAQGGRGCNITIPFKEDAYQFADRLTARAELAGAVNTLKKLDDGIILGDTTDGAGLVLDLQNYQVPITDARILIIGAGGAARGVIQSLLELKPQQIVITNRTFSKAELLANMFAELGPIHALAMDQVQDGFDLVINSTSASLSGELPQVSPAIFTSTTIAYDMMYGRGKTAFNQWALEQGVAQAYDGLGMLVGQAAESFMLWRGLRPGTKQILRELRKNLEGM
ncbi:shikimate dehydrogenase [Vibrio ponticus]|uniref:Shikimate dehydrogenase (NADP(+)) n=1 Tax=Vibrio ponticus TaxID=265668 RepID=A0A3N3E1A2_9VIBR|nr:shikimate dehydrogenase [Vibrio ponticus]OLQ94917.1 shikimate dehydrogenase [Vibrio ponticus]ROV60535.1 shikimate dehydrogenase [Vibrio ponticus]